MNLTLSEINENNKDIDALAQLWNNYAKGTELSIKTTGQTREPLWETSIWVKLLPHTLSWRLAYCVLRHHGVYHIGWIAAGKICAIGFSSWRYYWWMKSKTPCFVNRRTTPSSSLIGNRGFHTFDIWLMRRGLIWKNAHKMKIQRCGT